MRCQHHTIDVLTAMHGIAVFAVWELEARHLEPQVCWRVLVQPNIPRDYPKTSACHT